MSLALEDLPLERIVPYERNARKHPEKQVRQLVRSIREFGFLVPVLVDGAGNLVAGHGRVLAARELGMESVPALRAEHLTPKQRRAFVTADNRLAENSAWDADALGAEIKLLDSEGFDLSLLGFSEREIDHLLKLDDALDDAADDAPDLGPVAVSQLGDVWLLGAHRLVCGDARTPATVGLACGQTDVALVYTDPPYGVAYKGRRTPRRAIENDALDAGELKNLLVGAFSNARAVGRAERPWYIWHPGGSPQTAAFYLALAEVGLHPSAQIIWVKNNFTIHWGHYHARHEPCLYISPGHERWYGGKRQSTVWECSRGTGYKHPTQKPVELAVRAIENSSQKGETVLDLFAGSGSTLIACEIAGRVGAMVELDLLYADLIVRRFQRFTGETGHHIDGRSFAEIEKEKAAEAA